MPAGLINIAIYGGQDLYLTGTPEITHFKTVYRRHTNFSSESIRVNIDDAVGFDVESKVVLPRVGDLIHKIYVEIVLPEVQLTRTVNNLQSSEAYQAYLDALIDLNKIADFMSLNIEAYRGAQDEYQVENDSSIATMKSAILREFNISSVGNSQDDVNVIIVNNFRDLIAGLFSESQVNLNYIAENTDENDPTITKKIFFGKLSTAVNKSYKIQKYFREIVNQKYALYLESINKIIKFAWVKKLGHAIIEYVDVYIGGEKIDRHYGVWLDIWHELTGNKEQEETYLKMIGDIPSLTTFDRTVKPKYILQVPLQFWFNRFNGLALPLIAIQYNEISLNIKLRRFDECAYIEELSGEQSLNDFVENFNLLPQMSLLVDYIYLDGTERRKFAQSSHEYLIEQVQTTFFSNIQQRTFSTKLDFNHPTKELIWVVQRTTNTINDTGTQETLLWNYGVTNTGTINPVLTSKISFNGYDRVIKLTGNYFNYAQPHMAHRNTPRDGINIYSFSVFPEESQPSGSCNFTRINNFVIDLEITDLMFTLNGNRNPDDPTTVNIMFFGTNLNILRIIGGMAGLAYA